MTYSTRHYGAGDPNCPICGGVGYVSYNVPEDHPQFGKVLDCQCRQARAEAERRAALRRLGGLEALADKTFETFNPDGVGLPEKERDSLRRVVERCTTFAAQPQGWLALVGGYGCGKTHLAAAIANARIAAGQRVLFISVPDLLDALRASFRPDEEPAVAEANPFEAARTIPLLVLDDMGVESPTPWAMEKLYQILNARYNARLATVITTNRSLEDLEMRLRSRLFDPDVCQVLPITAPDYRRSGVGAAHSDLNSLGLYEPMTFETFKARRDLTKDQKDNLSLVVQVARQYAEDPHGFLVLLGGYSTGKTHLAAAIAHAQARQGVAVLFVTAPDLLDHLRAAYAPNSAVSYDKRFAEVRAAPLLVLDDLSTESATPWAREKLQQLINHRFNTRLPTVITTAQELEKLDQRLVTRLRDLRLSTIVALEVPPYLGEKVREKR